MRYTRVLRPAYELERDTESLAADIHWRLELRGQQKGTAGYYVFGRDSFELLPNLSSGQIRPGKAEILNPRSQEFSPLIAHKLTLDRFQFTLRSNRTAAGLFDDPVWLRTISSQAPDTFLSKVRERDGDTLSALGAISESIDLLQSVFSRRRGVARYLSLDSLEDTYFLIAILSCINHRPECPWVVIGPARYTSAFKLTPVERPYLLLSDVTDMISHSSGTSLINVNNRLNGWSKSLGLSDEISAGVSGQEMRSFSRWVLNNGDLEAQVDQIVPPQTAAPINARVRESRVETIPQLTDSNATIDVGLRHIQSILEGIKASSNLDNWSPLANRKVDRTEKSLDALLLHDTTDAAACVAFGLEIESLRQTVESATDELMPEIAREFSIFFLQANLTLQQLPHWQSFLENAEKMGWGKNCSPHYVSALQEVYQRITESDGDLFDLTIKSYSKDTSQNLTPSPPEVSGSSLSLRNILSACMRAMLKARGFVTKSVTDHVSAAFQHGLDNLFTALQSQLLTISRENPSLLGWIESAARLLGWIK